MRARTFSSLIGRGTGKLLCTVLLLWLIPGSAPAAQSDPPRVLVEENTAFALDLYAQLKARPGNLFFSPYNISTALAMTYAGARGDSGKQMAKVLRFDQSGQQIHASFGQLQRQIGEAAQQNGIELNIANALWAQKRHPFLPDFLKISRDDYQANINQADFLTGAEAARSEINGWVAQKTKDKIQEILPPGSLDELTRLVLANAIYFKGTWAKRYEKGGTSTQPFHVTAIRKTNVPLMHHWDEIKYMENSDYQAVELPYNKWAFSMVVLLPRQVDGCGGLENRLTPELLSTSLRQMEIRNVEIFLPRFKLESDFRLNDTLAKMGMPDVFGDKADFSGMDGAKFLYISAVLHKGWVQVNEEGTEAVAVTGMELTRGTEPPAAVFRADHPFLFVIRDTRSGSILFLGRFAEPT